MGTYNNSLAVMTCPRCNTTVECIVDLYFGNTSKMVNVPIGSQYPFVNGCSPQNGGPLTFENPLGAGYTQCPSCNRDFHCLAEVQDGLLVSVSPDIATLPYIHDRDECGTMACPRCGGLDTSARFFNGFSIGQIVCLSKECDFVGEFQVGRSGIGNASYTDTPRSA